MTFKKEVKPCASWKHTPNTKKTSLQRGKRRFPMRSTARMYERVLAKWCLPVHSIFFALLKGKVKDNNSVLNMFRCFVTRGSCRKPEFSEMKKKAQKGRLCILLTVSYFTAFLKHLRRDLVKRGWLVDILNEDGFHIFLNAFKERWLRTPQGQCQVWPWSSFWVGWTRGGNGVRLHSPFPQVDNSEDPSFPESPSAFSNFARWIHIHTGISLGCVHAYLLAGLICAVGVKDSTWTKAAWIQTQLCAYFLVI